MTQYVLILHATLAVNVLAIAHRCRLHQRLAVLVRQRRCWSDLEDGCRGGCGCGTVNGTTDDCPGTATASNNVCASRIGLEQEKAVG